MEAIKDTVKDIMQALKNKNKEASPDNHPAMLQKILTKKEVRHIKFNYFKKGVLGLSVDSSSWLYHLNLKKEPLLAKLAKKSRGSIKDIHFHLGDIKCPEK